MSENDVETKKKARNFYYILINVVISSVTNMTVWFAIIFYTYLQTKSVLATSIISGLYLVSVASTGFWFGSIVDSYKKKNVMIVSSLISLVVFSICFIVYNLVDHSQFTYIASPVLWAFVVLIMIGVIAGNLRSIALPTLVTLLIEEDKRDKANGLVGTATGVAFLVVSVISGILVGHSGMFLVLLFASLLSLAGIAHLLTINIEENKVSNSKDNENPEENQSKSKIDIKGTLKLIRSVPGLFSLILFTTFNNFLGGVFMSLMDAYGLSLVEVEVWGVLWGILSTAFILGGIIIARRGLGKNPLGALFMTNITIWIITCFFTIQPSIILLMIGMYIYLSIVPFIEAAEHTIIQKVVPAERQGRIFGFAQSIEQTASPLTAFLIGPITELVFIPFMTTGAGVALIGSWFGTGENRGIALVFTITGIIGLIVTVLAMRSRFYKQLSGIYTKE